MDDEQVLISSDLPLLPSPKFRGFRRRRTSRAKEPGVDSAGVVVPDAQSLLILFEKDCNLICNKREKVFFGENLTEVVV